MESGGGFLFADDFMEVSELRNLIHVVHPYCQNWRLKANVSKSAAMNFWHGFCR